MWIFLSLLLILGFIHTAINVTLLGSVRGKLLACLSLSGVVFIFFPFSAKINFQAINEYLSRFSSLSTACCYQVFESIMVMLVSLVLIRNHYTKNKKQIWALMALCPAGLFFVGLFLIQTYLFHMIEAMPFWIVSLSFAFSSCILLLLLSFLLSQFVTRWEWKLELKVMLSFIQMLMAMFLPLVVLRNKVLATQFAVSFTNSVVPVLFMAGLFGLGLLRQKYFQKERLL